MSKTVENLKAAFAGESQARNMYTFFAKVARKEGYHYIAKIFEESAANEEQHAKDHFKLLNGIGDTIANLQEAINGENYETTEMYPTFAKEAEEEGNSEAASLFRQIARIEAHHRDRYQQCLDMVKAGTVFKRDEPIRWKCSKCGFTFDGQEAPPKCPSCKHARDYFEPANMDIP
ncbi:rubrerythrin [Desulfomarina profundi]|uniref:Rubrerythrin n=1 Tax=Desulfomarina profundi TaxID=2772557 RepID=A0A8D5FIB3_9BACT|nr:rubrerythrin family protein [Desulfomarina profundi]BCL61888.1 rubrerythrin [Desulfomarina profundi]